MEKMLCGALLVGIVVTEENAVGLNWPVSEKVVMKGLKGKEERLPAVTVIG
jgi:hypothetical protein